MEIVKKEGRGEKGGRRRKERGRGRKEEGRGRKEGGRGRKEGGRGRKGGGRRERKTPFSPPPMGCLLFYFNKAQLSITG